MFRDQIEKAGKKCLGSEFSKDFFVEMKPKNSSCQNLELNQNVSFHQN